LAHQTVEQLQRREERWAIVDLIGKAYPNGSRSELGQIIRGRLNGGSGISSVRVFRCVSKRGSVWGTAMSEKVVWCVVRECAAKAGIVN
jgi:hypothetical protein